MTGTLYIEIQKNRESVAFMTRDGCTTRKETSISISDDQMGQPEELMWQSSPYVGAFKHPDLLSRLPIRLIPPSEPFISFQLKVDIEYVSCDKP